MPPGTDPDDRSSMGGLEFATPIDRAEKALRHPKRCGRNRASHADTAAFGAR